MRSDPSVIGAVVSILSGTFPSGACPAVAGPQTRLRPFDQSPPGSPTPVILDIHSDAISSGQTNDYDVPVDQLTQATFAIDYQSGGPTFEVVQPDGTVLTPTSSGAAVYETSSSNGFQHADYTVTSPMIGHWTLRTIGSSADSSTNYTVSGTGMATMTLSSATASIQFNSSCFITAQLADSSSTSVTGAVITANCTAPDGTSATVTLLDDGLHNDGAANDGVYAGQLIAPAPGVYTASIRATGNYAGNDFVRLGCASFTVSPATASLTGVYSAVGVPSSTGLYASLQVNVGLNVVSGSSFQVYGELDDSSGNTITTAVTSRTDLVVGNNAVALSFDGDAVRRSGASSFTLTRVVVADTSTDPALDVLEADNVYSFGGFTGTQFVDTTPPASVTDLTVAGQTGNSVTLTWTAPDNEGSAAASYDLRWSNDGFSTASWTNGVVVPGVPIPAAPGTLQTLTVNVAPGQFYWFCIRSYDAAGNLSDLSNLATADLASSYYPGMGSGNRVTTSGVVTAVFADRIYVEQPNRAYGVALAIAATDTFTQGETVQAYGNLAHTNGENEIINTAILPTGTAAVPSPLGVINKSLGTRGAGNVGLLVKIWGKYTYINSSTFTVDDGSGTPITCTVPSGVTLDPDWEMVTVTGISSLSQGGSSLLLVRSQSDISVVQ